jgi:hypothetical protein
MGFITKFKSIFFDLIRPKSQQLKDVLIRRPLHYHKKLKSLTHGSDMKWSISNIVKPHTSSVVSYNINHKRIKSKTAIWVRNICTSLLSSININEYQSLSQKSIPELRVSKVLITDKYIKKK